VTPSAVSSCEKGPLPHPGGGIARRRCCSRGLAVARFEWARERKHSCRVGVAHAWIRPATRGSPRRCDSPTPRSRRSALVRSEHVVGGRPGCRNAWRSGTLVVATELTARIAQTRQHGRSRPGLPLHRANARVCQPSVDASRALAEAARGVCAVAVRLLLTGGCSAQPAVSSLAGTWGAARLSAPCPLVRFRG
jgi:hypothetical protein